MTDVVRDGTLFGHNESGAGQVSTLAATVNGISAGGCVVVLIGYDLSMHPIGVTTSITDDLGANAGAAVVSLDDPNITERFEIYVFKNYGGGNRTFTVTLNQSQIGVFIQVIPLINADLTTPVAGVASATAATANPSTGNISPTPTRNGSYGVGICTSAGGGPPTSGSPWSSLFNDTTDAANTETYAQATAAAIAATWTAGAAEFLCTAVMIQPATGGGGGQAPTEDDAYLPMAAPAPGPNLVIY